MIVAAVTSAMAAISAWEEVTRAAATSMRQSLSWYTKKTNVALVCAVGLLKWHARVTSVRITDIQKVCVQILYLCRVHTDSVRTDIISM